MNTYKFNGNSRADSFNVGDRVDLVCNFKGGKAPIPGTVTKFGKIAMHVTLDNGDSIAMMRRRDHNVYMVARCDTVVPQGAIAFHKV